MKTQQDLFIQMVLDAWNIHIQRFNQLIEALGDEQLKKQIAPGKNRGVYLLGHLAAIHDKVLPLLGLGEQLFPEIYQQFVNEADSPEKPTPAVESLRNQWNAVNNKLAEHFNKLSADQWFDRHTAVNEEDFRREPNRNRLNLVMNRTNHLAMHYGQLLLLKSKSSIT
jgi:hypothetical protein